ncbi:cytochrome c551 [Rummeliibacillus pycnus]|uniref:cytochrome c551 n=1 Tax=Rummeliibacillus pycnus TaxID=101070 RepID=UPI003D2E3528
MKKALLAMLLGSALVMGACGTTNKTTTTETKTGTTDNTATTEKKTTETTKVDAEAITKQKCISCHGNDLSGAVGPDLRKIGATLSEDQIKDVLKNGKGSMPAGLVSGADLDAVAKWLSEKK